MLKMTENTPNAEYTELALDIIEGSLREGWDWGYGGGLLYMMDVAGRPLVDQTVTATSKLWWPMTEALIAITMALVRTGDWQRSNIKFDPHYRRTWLCQSYRSRVSG